MVLYAADDLFCRMEAGWVEKQENLSKDMIEIVRQQAFTLKVSRWKLVWHYDN